MRLRATTIYVAFLLSGAAALIYQCLWIRLFGLFFGTCRRADGSRRPPVPHGIGLFF